MWVFHTILRKGKWLKTKMCCCACALLYIYSHFLNESDLRDNHVFHHAVEEDTVSITGLQQILFQLIMLMTDCLFISSRC